MAIVFVGQRRPVAELAHHHLKLLDQSRWNNGGSALLAHADRHLGLEIIGPEDVLVRVLRISGGGEQLLQSFGGYEVVTSRLVGRQLQLLHILTIKIIFAMRSNCLTYINRSSGKQLSSPNIVNIREMQVRPVYTVFLTAHNFKKRQGHCKPGDLNAQPKPHISPILTLIYQNQNR